VRNSAVRIVLFLYVKGALLQKGVKRFYLRAMFKDCLLVCLTGKVSKVNSFAPVGTK
jgi:hypothetical protein